MESLTDDGVLVVTFCFFGVLSPRSRDPSPFSALVFELELVALVFCLPCLRFLPVPLPILDYDCQLATHFHAIFFSF